MSPEMRQKRHCVFRQPASRGGPATMGMQCGASHGDLWGSVRCTARAGNGEGRYCLNSQAMVPMLSRPNSFGWQRNHRPPRARPEASGRTGRAVPGTALVSDQRCIERQRGKHATAGYYNYSDFTSSTTVSKRPSFGFRDFWRSREGHLWRVERPTTPFLVSPSPSASSAFNAIC